MLDNLKFFGLLCLVILLLAVPAIVTVVWRGELPTAQEACRGHRGVASVERAGHFSSVATYTALCRDGYDTDVTAP